jgi:hypothetical protein
LNAGMNVPLHSGSGTFGGEGTSSFTVNGEGTIMIYNEGIASLHSGSGTGSLAFIRSAAPHTTKGITHLVTADGMARSRDGSSLHY